MLTFITILVALMAPPVGQLKLKSSKGKQKQNKVTSKYASLPITVNSRNSDSPAYVNLVSPPSRQNSPSHHLSQSSSASRPITISSQTTSVRTTETSASSHSSSQATTVPFTSPASTVAFHNPTQTSTTSFLAPSQVSVQSNSSQSSIIPATSDCNITLSQIGSTQDLLQDFDATYFEEPMDIPCSQRIVVHKNIRLETPEPQPGTSRGKNLPVLCDDDLNMVLTQNVNEPATSNCEFIFNNTTKLLASNLTELQTSLNHFKMSKDHLNNQRQTELTNIENIDNEITRLQRERDIKAMELNSLNERINKLDTKIENFSKCISGIEECHRVMENINLN